MHLNEVYGRVKSCFRWGPDYETSGRFEYWDTFTDQVRSGVQVKRDCDDFALTVLELGIADYGWDRDKCRVARVASELCP
ncbi:MAG: hypothetical protein OIF55_01540, partial [Amphritea sp.]|nr:hypothetical protein [Amphritea sp.]